MTWFDPARTLISDTECYRNFWCIGFKRRSDGKTLVLEHSHRRQLDRSRLDSILRQNLIVGFNWQGYDRFMVTKAALHNSSTADLKQLNDQIIVGRLRYWEVEDAAGFRVPRDYRFVDLMEAQPSVAAKNGGGDQRPPGLKLAMARMHAPRLQDLPYSPDSDLTEDQMDEVISYMGNDLDGTEMLFDNLQDALHLRATFGKKYRVDMLSKSDSQCGEAIFKRRVEEKTGRKVAKAPSQAGTSFRFKSPAFIRFDPGSELESIYARICETDFIIGADGKVTLPEWLSSRTIDIGQSAYQMGIGGLHSTESNRAIWSDEQHILVDFDVGSYYPNTILNAGLYPKAIGPEFLGIYGELTADRLAAKAAATSEDISDAERAIAVTAADGVKIFVNGGGFGKLGSAYSVLYAPHLMVAVTLTGQLALLMLIQRAEKAGISVVSANTDGVVFRASRAEMGPIIKDRVTSGSVSTLIAEWERDTGFTLEATEYKAIFNTSVNEYIALKPNGKAKRKGKLSNPYREGTRTMLMKNPNAGVCSDAVVKFLADGTPIEETIRNCTEIRDFVTAVQVSGGAIWRGDNSYLGKVVRFIWVKGGAEIVRKKGHHKTGTQGKVSKSDGCRPLMQLPDVFPVDIDYARYMDEAREILRDIGAEERAPVIKPLRIFKHSAVLHWAIAV